MCVCVNAIFNTKHFSIIITISMETTMYNYYNYYSLYALGKGTLGRAIIIIV